MLSILAIMPQIVNGICALPEEMQVPVIVGIPIKEVRLFFERQ